MPVVSQHKIAKLLAIAGHATTSAEKGRALEEVICYLFEKVPGISITMRNRLNVFKSEEIDLAFWNDQNRAGLYFAPHIVVVECKNWSTPLGSEEVSWLDHKIERRGLNFGVLVAANGITGDSASRSGAHDIIANALAKQRTVVVMTLEEILALTNTDQLVRKFKEKLCELAVSGSVFS